MFWFMFPSIVTSSRVSRAFRALETRGTFSRTCYLLHALLQLSCIHVIPLVFCLSTVSMQLDMPCITCFPASLVSIALFSLQFSLVLFYTWFLLHNPVNLFKTFQALFVPLRSFIDLIGFYKGAVTNSQIIQKPLYLDNPPPKSSLPPIQPFKRHVHVPNQAREKHTSGHSGTAERESDSDSICLALKGKLSEVWFLSKIAYSKNPRVRTYVLCSSCILGKLLVIMAKQVLIQAGSRLQLLITTKRKQSWVLSLDKQYLFIIYCIIDFLVICFCNVKVTLLG